MKKVCFLLFIFILAQNSFAQDLYKTHFGFYGGAMAKPNFTSKNINWFAAYEAGINLHIEPVENSGLGLLVRLGFLADPIRHKTGKGESIWIFQSNLAFDALIVFPTKLENLKMLGGIGFDFCFKPAIGYGVYSGSSSANYTMNLDSIEYEVDTYRRRIIPSVSAGLSYEWNKNWSVYFLIEQNLLDLFTKDITLTYGSNTFYTSTSLNYKPSYFKLGLSYFIR